MAKGKSTVRFAVMGAALCTLLDCTAKQKSVATDMNAPTGTSGATPGAAGSTANSSAGTTANAGHGGASTATATGGSNATGRAGTAAMASAGSSAVAGAAGSMAGASGGNSGGGGMLASAGASGAAPATGPGCMVTPMTAGDHMMMMLMHGSTPRQYNIHVPASYDGTKAVPLVLDFHGWTSSASEEEAGGSDMMGSGWKVKSESVGFIVVYPIGLDGSWNGGALCCGTSQSSGVDDEGFAVDLVQKMKQDTCIDPKRVYVTGISNGGAMTHLLACKHADLFAAAAPVSMGNGTTPCSPSRPISVVMFRGQMDDLVPYGGGGLLGFPSAQSDFDMWKAADGCTGTSTKNHTYCETYTGCGAGTEVTLCSLPMAGHIVYDDKAEIVVADVAWETFERYVLP